MVLGAFFLHRAFCRVFSSYRNPVLSRLPLRPASRGRSVRDAFLYSWAVSGVVAVVGYRYNERLTGLIMMPLSIMAFIFSFLNMTAPRKLPLILRTYWFELHVITSFAAYALFTLALSSAVFFIIRSYRQGEGTPASTPTHAPHEYPGARDFLDITGRAILFGFFFFSVSMFSGAIWGFVAWGAYWMWEPKMLWSFVVWFWYAGAMHLWYMKVTPLQRGLGD